MGDVFKIVLAKKKKQGLQPGQVPVTRLTVEAYNALVGVVNITDRPMKDIASEIILQAIKHIEYKEED